MLFLLREPKNLVCLLEVVCFSPAHMHQQYSHIPSLIRHGRCVCMQGQNVTGVPTHLRHQKSCWCRQYDMTLHLVQNCQHVTFHSVIPPPCSIKYGILQILTEMVVLCD